jgi:glyoxylase-like metal-dependent hydrolase (beta-lactamase superfamily II)
MGGFSDPSKEAKLIHLLVTPKCASWSYQKVALENLTLALMQAPRRVRGCSHGYKGDRQGGEITSGVHYIAAPGHSPSHASILFTSGKDQFMHMGDIAHNPVTSLQHPDWTPVFDYDPAQAIKSRKAILDRVATDGVMVMGYHFPFPAIGHVVRHGTAYHWEAAQWAW